MIEDLVKSQCSKDARESVLQGNQSNAPMSLKMSDFSERVKSVGMRRSLAHRGLTISWHRAIRTT